MKGLLAIICSTISFSHYKVQVKTVAYSQIFQLVYVHAYRMHSSNKGYAGIPMYYIQYKYYITVTKIGFLVTLFNLENVDSMCFCQTVEHRPLPFYQFILTICEKVEKIIANALQYPQT